MLREGLTVTCEEGMDEITNLQIGDRVRFKRPRSTIWREGSIKRWSYSRAGRMLAQISVDVIGGQRLKKPETARLRPEQLTAAYED
jgi:hypothetical protein